MRNMVIILLVFAFGTALKGDVKQEHKHEYIWGIDVSHFQHDVNWELVQKDGVMFAMAKASEGITSIDPNFQKNWKGIKNQGLIRGAYHFFIAGDAAEAQAETYLKVVGELEKYDLPPVLDVERGGYSHARQKRVTVSEFQKSVLNWLKIVEERTGKRPIIYTGKRFADEFLRSYKFRTYKLWIAEYGVVEPDLPVTWEKTGFTFWQKTAKEELHGVEGKVDYDVFKGTYEELKKLASSDEL